MYGLNQICCNLRFESLLKGGGKRGKDRSSKGEGGGCNRKG